MAGFCAGKRSECAAKPYRFRPFDFGFAAAKAEKRQLRRAGKLSGHNLGSIALLRIGSRRKHSAGGEDLLQTPERPLPVLAKLAAPEPDG